MRWARRRSCWSRSSAASRSAATRSWAPELPITDSLDEAVAFSPVAARPGPGEPPFVGGAVGYLSYDWVSQLEPVPLPPAHPDDAGHPHDAVHARLVRGRVRPRPPHALGDRPGRRGGAGRGGAERRRPRVEAVRRPAGERVPRPAVSATWPGSSGRRSTSPPATHSRSCCSQRVRRRHGRLALRPLPGAACREPFAVHVPARHGRPPAGRLLARDARAPGRGRHLRAAPDRRHAAARRRPRGGRRGWRWSCWPRPRSGPST